jgi:predicted transcriptional regulator
MAESKTIDPRLVAEIVASYVSHNSIATSELPNLIAIIHRCLAELGKPAGMPAPTPAVAINRSYSRDFVVCLDCGWRGLILRRHLTVGHGLSPHDYRARWNLRDTHPLVAPAYSERRSSLAKQLGLGRGRQASAAAPEPPAPPPKRRGRSRRTTP